MLEHKSSGSSLTAFRGLALRLSSKRQMVVQSTSSVRIWLSKIAVMNFLQLCTSLSQVPPKCGGFKLRTTYFDAKSLSISALSHSGSNAFNSLAAPKRFVTRSLMMVIG